MTSSTGFQMDMLLWAAKQAKELDMHALFKHCLQSILAASGKNGVAGQAIDSLTVVRYVVVSNRIYTAHMACLQVPAQECA